MNDIQYRAWIEAVTYLREHGIEPSRVHFGSVTAEGYSELQAPPVVDAFTGRVKTRYRRWPEGFDASWFLAALSLSRK